MVHDLLISTLIQINIIIILPALALAPAFILITIIIGIILVFLIVSLYWYVLNDSSSSHLSIYISTNIIGLVSLIKS